jgi:thioredoxin-related protein
LKGGNWQRPPGREAASTGKRSAIPSRLRETVITHFVQAYLMAESSSPDTYNYTCDECGASFMAMEDLTKHYRQDHPESL